VATTDPVGRLTLNFFTLQRIGTSITGEASAILEQLFDEIIRDLERIDPTGPSLRKWRDHRTSVFLAEVEARLKEIIPEWEKRVREGVAVAGRMQAKFAENLLVASLGDSGDIVRPTQVTQQRVRAILTARPFDGATMREWTQAISDTTLRRVSREVKRGLIAEEGLPDIVRRVRGTPAGFLYRDPESGQFASKGAPGALATRRYVGGVMQTTTRQAESLVRSAVSFITTESKLETYRENARLLAALEFQAVLDTQTTPVCWDLDGSRWEPDSDEIVVPGEGTHFGGCRSELVPVIDWLGLGLPEPEEGQRIARDYSDVTEKDFDKKVSTRRSQGRLGKSVQVPASMRYEQWLRDQPIRVQEEVLGVRRARAFRAREIDLRDLVRSDGRLVRIADLPQLAA
jgi:SPP1 gp7 family putative phage head morphogenesis protein